MVFSNNTKFTMICSITLISCVIVFALFSNSLSQVKNTATGVALARACCNLDDTHSCNDPYAQYFVPFFFRFVVLKLSKFNIFRDLLISMYDRKIPGAFGDSFFRTLWIDEKVNKHKDDVGQFVILGAGFDSRNIRMDFDREKVKSFEVDMPKIQSQKKDIVCGIVPDKCSHTIYVNGILGIDDWFGRLEKQGFERSKKTLFLMEGLLPYLQEDVVIDIFKNISLLDESIVIATYDEKSGLENPENYYGGPELLKFVMERGEFSPERNNFGLDGEDSEKYFRKFGFDVEEVIWSSKVSPFGDPEKYRAIDGHNLAVLVKTSNKLK